MVLKRADEHPLKHVRYQRIVERRPLPGNPAGISIVYPQRKGEHHGHPITHRQVGEQPPIRIPKPVAEQWGVREGSRIEMVSRGDQLVMSKRAYDLAEMLARMSPETLHGEIDTGPSQGREEW